MEIDPQLHHSAVQSYRQYLPHLLPQVTFHLGHSTEIFPSVLEQAGAADAVFLDGAQQPTQTLAELKMFESFMRPGAILMCHDWSNEKMTLVRPYVEELDCWEIVDRIGHPLSVGFVVYKKR